MITSAQIRAGRGLLKWTQGVLAARAALSVVTLNMIESDQVTPRPRTLDAIRRALEGEGVRFIDGEEGVGAVLRRVGTVEPTEALPGRYGRAKPDDLRPLPDKVPHNPPLPGDDLPADLKARLRRV